MVAAPTKLLVWDMAAVLRADTAALRSGTAVRVRVCGAATLNASALTVCAPRAGVGRLRQGVELPWCVLPELRLTHLAAQLDDGSRSTSCIVAVRVLGEQPSTFGRSFTQFRG